MRPVNVSRSCKFYGIGAWNRGHPSSGIFGRRLEWEERHVSDGPVANGFDLRIVGWHPPSDPLADYFRFRVFWLKNIWPAFGQHFADIWVAFGQHLAEIWFDLANIWLIFVDFA
jgi:hypothetical protein